MSNTGLDVHCSPEPAIGRRPSLAARSRAYTWHNGSNHCGGSMRRRWGRVLLALAAAAFALFIALPIAAIGVRALASGALLAALARPVVLEALRLSVLTTLATLGLALLGGTPL